LGTFGIGGVDRDYCRGANGAFFIAGVIDDEAIAGLHFAEIAKGYGIGYAVPDSRAIFLQVGEGVCGGFGLQKIVCHCELHSALFKRQEFNTEGARRAQRAAEEGGACIC
jgi:hypothetical protein